VVGRNAAEDHGHLKLLVGWDRKDFQRKRNRGVSGGREYERQPGMKKKFLQMKGGQPAARAVKKRKKIGKQSRIPFYYVKSKRVSQGHRGIQ